MSNQDSPPPSGRHAHTEATEGGGSNSNADEILLDDHNGKGIILGDALSINRDKDTTIASVEELQNFWVVPILRGIDLDSMSIGQRDALLLFRDPLQGALVGLLKPGTMSMFGTLLVIWGLVKEGLLGKPVNTDPAKAC
ncbi:hypothetical protein IFM89_033906 [Coptis chinensis]|uniref:Uncharacterized protein n=1 Tax=Coptis chinensis TaxID=261450 RepID=A0A835I1F2_9MAGN|nr:hypothetical protein IFM89_033906 [Coptis chinensis]